MTKRVSIEIPEKMYQLISRYGGLHGLDADDYATMALARHLEDLHDVAVANAELARVNRAEYAAVTSDEFWRELED